MSFALYVPRDRMVALIHGSALPERTFGAALFADISGFTRLADALAHELGPHRGAEELTRHLNAVYDALITIIHRHGGSVVSFSGDAITCWFDAPGGHGVATTTIGARAARCGLNLQHTMARLADIATPAGQRFTLALKVAISVGPVRRLLIGDPLIQQLDVLAGPTLMRLAAAEQHTMPGEVMTDSATVALLADALHIGAWREDGEGAASFAVIDDVTNASDAHSMLDSAAQTPSLGLDQIRPFLLPPIAERLARGYGDPPTELRPAVALFLRFATLDYDHQPDAGAQLNAYICWVQAVLSRYGGALIDVTIGDKGSYVYAVFGAPIAHENDAERALHAALELRAPPAELAAIGTAQIGIVRGTMRAGVYGGSGRLTYGVLGDGVNVAARLMQAASAGQVLVGAAVHQACGPLFMWEKQPPLPVKGKAAPLSVFELLAAREWTVPTFYQGALVGRAVELERLLHAAKPIHGGRFAGVCYVDGDAGIGKSRLVFEAQRRLAQDLLVTWMYCPSDEVLRGSLRPFANFLYDYFQQSITHDEAGNKARFAAKLASVISVLTDDTTQGEQAHALASELDRTRSFLGALLGLRWGGTLYEQLEPKLRFENMLGALVTLIKAESLRQPVWLELEDAHWLDDDSRTLVATLSRALVGFPVLIVCVARPNDDGEPTRLPLGDDTPTAVIDLAALTRDGSQMYAEQVLEHRVTTEFAEIVHERTGGNPFFIEQLLLDLRERGLIENREPNVKKRELALNPRFAADVPDTLNSLLVARLDRLDAPVREVVQTAAVLGREWTMPLLAAMRAGDDDLAPKVRVAEEGRVWSALGERDYLFRHVLLRDAAYGMQLQAQRRELHLRALQAIEQEYSENLPTQYPALTYHANQAEEHDRERRYAKLAGEAAAARYANAEAISYLSRALELTSEEDLEGRWEVLFARVTVAHGMSDQGLQEGDLRALDMLGEALQDEKRRAEVALRRALFAEIMSDFAAAAQSAREALEIGRQSGLSHIEARAGIVLGGALFRTAHYTEALSAINHALEISRRDNDAALEATSLRQLARIVADQGNTADALQFGKKALAVTRRTNDRLNEAVTLHSLGVYADDQGDHATARDFFIQSQTISQEIGYRILAASTIDSLGLCANRLGDFEYARECCEQALLLHRETGYRGAEQYTLINLSYIYANLDDCVTARVYAEQGLSGVRALGLRYGEGYAWWALGNALSGLGEYQQAKHAYEEAIAVEQAIGLEAPAIEAIAGLARVALAQGSLRTALEHVESILAYLPDGTLHTMEMPVWVYLTCCNILSKAKDPRAPTVVEEAHHFLQSRAAKLSDDAARRMFLEKVPHHRELIAAWEAAQARSGTTTTAGVSASQRLL